MITALAARWLTVVFADAWLGAALPRRGRAGAADAAGRVPAVMCAALTAMTRQSEPAAVAWAQAALLGCAALWSGPASLAGPGARPGSEFNAMMRVRTRTQPVNKPEPR